MRSKSWLVDLLRNLTRNSNMRHDNMLYKLHQLSERKNADILNTQASELQILKYQILFVCKMRTQEITVY